LNPEVSFPVNITTTFFNSLTAHMQDKINRRQYQLPPPGTNQEQLEQLQKLRDLAAEDEKEIETQIHLIKTTLNPTGTRPYYAGGNTRQFQTRAPVARTFMATVGAVESNPYGEHTTGGDIYSTSDPHSQYHGQAGGHKDDPLMEQFNRGIVLPQPS
jgi:hypothetical protein